VGDLKGEEKFELSTPFPEAVATYLLNKVFKSNLLSYIAGMK